MKLKLSYDLSSNRRYYAGKQFPLNYSTIDDGNKFCRETDININSHVGTHIDYPAHVFADGIYGDEYPFDYLCSSKVAFFEINQIDSAVAKITVDDIKMLTIPEDCEILLLKTGYCNIRDEDKYWQESPVIDPEIPKYLKTNFKYLRGVAFDIVSLTSQIDKSSGRLCHQSFMEETLGRSLLVIEDVDMSKLHQDLELKDINILPITYENMDGALCVIFAEI